MRQDRGGRVILVFSWRNFGIRLDAWLGLACLFGPVYYVIIFVLIPNRRKVAAFCGISLILLWLVGGVVHTSIVPPRWEAKDHVIVAASVLASVAAGLARLDTPTLVVLALFQSLVTIGTFSNFYFRQIVLDGAEGVFQSWATIGSLYVVCFVSLASGVRLLTNRSRDPLRCRKCGYLLIRLPEPRCPECGTPFSPEEIAEAKASAATPDCSTDQPAEGRVR